jgi:hypothetical protein
MRLNMTQRAANTFVFPGMKVSPIITPSGGVSLDTTVLATGYNRIASLMVPLRWGKPDTVARSRGSTSASSA